MGVDAAASGVIFGVQIFIVFFLPLSMFFFGILQYLFISKKVTLLKQSIAIPVYCLIGQFIKLYFVESLELHLIDYLAVSISVAAIVLLPLSRWLFKPSWSKERF